MTTLLRRTLLLVALVAALPATTRLFVRLEETCC